MDWERLAIAAAFGTESQIRSSNVQTWLLLYTPDLGSNTFLSLSQGASTLLPLSLPPPVPSCLPFLLIQLCILAWCYTFIFLLFLPMLWLVNLPAEGKFVRSNVSTLYSNYRCVAPPAWWWLMIQWLWVGGRKFGCVQMSECVQQCMYVCVCVRPCLSVYVCFSVHKWEERD